MYRLSSERRLEVTDHRQSQQIDNYRLIRLLGAGQFGDVYLAEHINPQIRSQVAIKILRSLAEDDQRDFIKFLK